jgi:hypothetical protein
MRLVRDLGAKTIETLKHKIPICKFDGEFNTFRDVTMDGSVCAFGPGFSVQGCTETLGVSALAGWPAWNQDVIQ